MPNERVGVLFGLSSCTDRLSIRSLPRPRLQTNGENIERNYGGKLVVEEYGPARVTRIIYHQGAQSGSKSGE
ncbi:uncharacterized protein BJX67DRAFT_347024 [Aspergillus lucknowensis]|uniref:Uncharacterized protein n=1 Tax=Aspergillus lucknowensis TaxID=176173 RepID=A0ABR4LZ28_9EURO